MLGVVPRLRVPHLKVRFSLLRAQTRRPSIWSSPRMTLSRANNPATYAAFDATRADGCDPALRVGSETQQGGLQHLGRSLWVTRAAGPGDHLIGPYQHHRGVPNGPETVVGDNRQRHLP